MLQLNVALYTNAVIRKLIMWYLINSIHALKKILSRLFISFFVFAFHVG